MWCKLSRFLCGRVVILTKRSLSTGSTSATRSSEAVVRVRGDVPYGSREYLLLPPEATLEEVKVDNSLILASLRAHRNIIFAAKVHNTGGTASASMANDSLSTAASLVEVCSPLVHAALTDASYNGEQPQALATLHGLSAWVTQQLALLSDEEENAHKEPPRERLSTLWRSFTDIEMGAVRAIATGIPRLGHSVVGMGTYDDGAAAWTALAKEFVHSTVPEHKEPALYQATGGELVQIEHLADRQPGYLKSAGGAMARFVFFS